MEVTFHNVEICIEANSPKEAYDKLCQILGLNGVEYATSTYSTYQPGIGNSCQEPTYELFPNEED